MSEGITMRKWWGHLKTITAHKARVMGLCFRVGLYRQGLLHDLSKYGPREFLVGARYFQGDRSPNEAERLATGVSSAWLHHKGRVVEMFCDRVAASQTYQKERYTDASAWEYYAHSQDHYILHPKTRALLERLLLMLRDEGEERTLAYIRRQVLR